MSRVEKIGVGARTVRELGLALRSGPFRVALVLSVILHVVFLVAIRRGVPEHGEGGRIPLMRVRLLRPAAAPVTTPASAAAPAVRQQRQGKPVIKEPSREPLPQGAGPGAIEQSTAPAVASSAAEIAEIAETLVPGVPGTESGPPTPLTGTTESGPSDPAAADRQLDGRDGPESGAGAGAGAVAGPTASDGGSTHPRPGPHELAAVRRRIDARKVYPQIAVRNGWEGRVLVEMRLEDDGRLAAVRLLEGSGYTVLDEATITAVHRASPFPPVARVLTVPVEYRLVP